MLSIANVTMVVPTLFTIWIGIKADQTQAKKKWIVITGFIQAIIFTLLAFIITEPSLLAFSFICLFNILSDMLSDFSNGLRMPLFRNTFAKRFNRSLFLYTIHLLHLQFFWTSLGHLVVNGF